MPDGQAWLVIGFVSTQGGAKAARVAHNDQVTGSSPVPATIERREGIEKGNVGASIGRGRPGALFVGLRRRGL